MALSRKKKIIILVVAIVLLALIIAGAVFATRKDVPEVQTTKLETKPELRSTVTASGEVRPDSADLGILAAPKRLLRLLGLRQEQAEQLASVDARLAFLLRGLKDLEELAIARLYEEMCQDDPDCPAQDPPSSQPGTPEFDPAAFLTELRRIAREGIAEQKIEQIAGIAGRRIGTADLDIPAQTGRWINRFPRGLPADLLGKPLNVDDVIEAVFVLLDDIRFDFRIARIGNRRHDQRRKEHIRCLITGEI